MKSAEDWVFENSVKLPADDVGGASEFVSGQLNSELVKRIQRDALESVFGPALLPRLQGMASEVMKITGHPDFVRDLRLHFAAKQGAQWSLAFRLFEALEQ